MKNFKNLTLVLALAMGITVVSCTKDTASVVDEEQAEAVGISQDVLEKASSLYFNTDDLQESNIIKPDGTEEQAYLIEGDIVMSHDQLMNMELGDGTGSEQYRTNNLVSQNRTIRVIGYTGGGGYGLSSNMQTALQWAINNYNALNISLTFTLTFGTNYQSYDIVVYRVPNGQAGGVAGFPSGGNPYKWVQIFSGMDNYNTNVNEHVIGHEIGHSVGLRHTDWFSRQSCGQSGESANPDGAVHIPGTPTGYDPTSLMLACFNSGVDGEFNNNDRIALEYLY
ncbi:M57 family metalloprotease [uncultured Kordia sp.]|uniref:M57 family metalloprotease n=1 Tax=uncultured Kordia sp. TaxID=507699 RepID=UPI002625FC41|nr:M57 family metalloprotease [uncultured Kordia sp.]